MAAIRHQFGLDEPVPVQFFKYVDNALHGNLGISARNGIGVGRIIDNHCHALENVLGLATGAAFNDDFACRSGLRP